MVLRGNGVCSVAAVAYGTRQFIINDCSAISGGVRRRRASDSTFLPPPSQQLPTRTFLFSPVVTNDSQLYNVTHLLDI